MKFIYSGPPSGVTLQDGEQQREVLLHTGAEVDLPAEHDYTKTLVALNHLASAPEPAPQQKTAKARASSDDASEKGA